MIETNDLDNMLDMIDELMEAPDMQMRKYQQLKTIRSYLLTTLLGNKEALATGICQTCKLPTRRTRQNQP